MLNLNKNNWTRGASARDRNGKIVSPDSPHAVRYDLYSAVRKSCFDYDSFWAEILRLKLVIRKLYNTEEPVWKFNDRVEWSDIEKVLEIFD